MHSHHQCKSPAAVTETALNVDAGGRQFARRLGQLLSHTRATMVTAMARVLLESLTKRFGDVVAVDSVDLEVQDQELLVLVGPSGCGKSTMLRLIAGLEDVTSGRVTIGDRSVNSVPAKDRNIAMVFQNYALYPHMDVYRNMAFGLRMRKVPRDEIERRVRRTAEVLGIEDLFARRPAQLSGGQRQRVALGRAIVRDPEVFLLDEPLSNLDARLRVTMRSELVKLHRHLDATMIYVTHDQVEAMTMGDRLVVMRDGRIQQVDTPRAVYESPANRFVGEFIGSPPMNILDGRIAKSGNALFFVSGRLRLSIPNNLCAPCEHRVDQSVQFGIRPEDLQIRTSDETDPDCVGVSCEVAVAQLLGSDSLVELDHEGTLVMARLDGRRSYRIGEVIEVGFSMDRAHWFDAQSGRRL